MNNKTGHVVTPESSCRTVCLLCSIRRLSKSDPQRAVSRSLSSRVGGPTPPSVKVWTLVPGLPRFFTLLLLLRDQSCWLPAVAAEVDRLLRLMSRRPASLQCSACYLKTCCCILVLPTCARLVEQSSDCCNIWPLLVQGFEAGTTQRYAVALQKLVMCKLQRCLLASIKVYFLKGVLLLAVWRTKCDTINVT